MVDSNNDAALFAVVVIGVIGAVFYKATKDVDWDNVVHNLIFWGSIIIGSILLLTGIIVAIYFKLKRSRENRASHESFVRHLREQLSEITKNDFRTSEKVTQELMRVKEQRKKNTVPELKPDYAQAIANLEEQLADLKAEEDSRAEANLQEAAQIQQLYDFFKRRRSTKTIPEFALHFDDSIVRTAKERWETIDNQRKQEKAIREKAVEFITENGAFPSDFHHLRNLEQQIYKEVYNEYQAGKLVSIRNVKQSDRLLFEKGFALAKDLDDSQQKRFVKEYGFRKKFFTGFKGVGQYIFVRNDLKKETDYHFCWKHMFASLSKFKPELEKDIDGWRTDVAFTINGKSVAVEIETGLNNKEQLSQKQDWLNRHFDYWCFVCERKHLPRYRKLVDKQKSFVFTTGEAFSWLATIVR